MTYYRLAGFQSLSRLGSSKRKLDAMLLSMRLHVQYLLSLENSPRTRSACVTYLSNWHTHFLPGHADLVEQLEKMAAELGGTLREPRLPWKYDWLRKLGGYPLARRAQLVLPRIRLAGIIYLDRMRYRLENRAPLG